MGIFVSGDGDGEGDGEDGRAALGDGVAMREFATDCATVQGAGVLARVADACECVSGGYGEGVDYVGVR